MEQTQQPPPPKARNFLPEARCKPRSSKMKRRHGQGVAGDGSVELTDWVLCLGAVALGLNAWGSLYKMIPNSYAAFTTAAAF